MARTIGINQLDLMNQGTDVLDYLTDNVSKDSKLQMDNG